MPGLKRRGPPRARLSRRSISELSALEANVQELSGHRNAALRRLLASRDATTLLTQQEFWLEFSWIDQEYRVAVRQLAEFCAARRTWFDGTASEGQGLQR